MKQPPFRVMCIEVKPHWPAIAAKYNTTFPEVMDECVVTEIDEDVEGICFTLAEHGPDCGFACECFAVLPDESASEIDEQEREGVSGLHPVFDNIIKSFAKAL